MTEIERKNAVEHEKRYVENLLRLKQERPELRIVPWVDSEIVADDCCGWWLGSFGDCLVEKILSGKERWYEYDECDMGEVLIEFYGYEWYENAPDEELKPKYDALPWEEVITVYIQLPI